MVSGPILKGQLGSWCRWRAVAHQSSSDLLVFNWSRLDCMQLCTSSMHANRCCCRSCVADGLQRPDIWVLSAYRWGQKLCCSISPISSAVYNVNRIGPKTEPWGTPETSSTERLTWACHVERTACGHGDKNGTIPELVHPDQRSAAAACTRCYDQRCFQFACD